MTACSSLQFLTLLYYTCATENNEEIDLSDRGLPVVPTELYMGKEATLHLGKAVILNLSKNALQTLPERPLPSLSTVTASKKPLYTSAALPPVSAAYGDLLYHCANLQVKWGILCKRGFVTTSLRLNLNVRTQKLDLSHNLLRDLPVRAVD
jgi:Leucine-rich repeat (LRR) protein